MTRPFEPRRKAHAARWTDAQIDILRTRYPHQPSESVAAAIGRPLQSIWNKAQALGLRKTPEFLTAMGRENCANGTQSRFQPGHATWNKGISFQAGGASTKTRFPKGHQPHNHRPVGSTRVSADGYIEIKTAEPRTWRHLHRVVWEHHHGPIPRGMAVVFRDGNPANCTPENLATASRRDLMARNTIQNLPEPIKECIRLNNWIKRKTDDNRPTKHR